MPPMSPNSSLLKRYLPQAECEDDAVVGHLLCQIGEVVATRLGTIASANQEEVLDVTGLDRFDHFVRHTEHSVARESHHDGLGRTVLAEAWSLQGLIDHGREVAVMDVRHARPGHQAGGEDAILVRVAWLLDAVGGHEDGTGKGIEFLLLILPRASVIARQSVDIS